MRHAFSVILGGLFAASFATAASACGCWSNYTATPYVYGHAHYHHGHYHHGQQMYVVNQGPVISGPGIFTYSRPYSDAGYAYGTPYVRSYGGEYYDAPPVRRYHPRVVHRDWRWHGPAVHGPMFRPHRP